MMFWRAFCCCDNNVEARGAGLWISLITGNIVRETRLYNKYIPMLVGAGFTDNL
ncbi:hypothetical protein E5S67_04008 [Microcoleus sp. IPMA8]|uniref:Uncharacterized protein n=1 Tax=Microcoleus asticus IPMA8 TaxID=2563858 RepID=A0ABX2D3K9_9CYAN|nr:hypothetical protein [Microcoleus asticus IPMA8]